MCVITSIVAGITTAAVSTLSAIGTAAAGVASAVTGIGAVATGAGLAGTSIGLTGTGLAGLVTGGAVSGGAALGVGGALAGTATGIGSAIGGAITGVGTGLTTEAFAAGASSFSSSMSALGTTVVGDALGANTLSAGAATASGAATGATTSLGATSGVAAAQSKAALDTMLASGEAASASGAASASAPSAGSTLLQEAALLANAGSAGFSAYSAYTEGKEESAALKAQAEQARRNGQQILDSAEIEAKDLTRRQRQVIGKGKVAAAANGVMLENRAEAAPNMWEQDAVAEAAWDRSKLFTNANNKAQALFANGNEMLVQAKRARRSGNLRSVTNLIKGGAGMALNLYGKPSTTLYG